MAALFPPSLLQRLTGAYSIKIETRDRADAPWHRTTVWVAVDQATGSVYVRSVRGPIRPVCAVSSSIIIERCSASVTSSRRFATRWW